MQVGAGENQKPVGKGIVKGNVFLCRFRIQHLLFDMSVPMGLETLLEGILLKETVPSISQCRDEKLFLSTVVCSCWSCASIERVAEVPLAS